MPNRRRGRTKINDWHRTEVIAALHKRGISLASLCRQHGYHPTAFSKALSQPWPAIERLIALALGRSARTIWPSRYRGKHAVRAES